MVRNAFLKSSISAMAVATLLPRAQRSLASEVIEFRLTSAPLALSPLPGAHFAGLAYNGSIPGPLLRATHGQRVRVRYASRVNIPTSVHWHGMILPNAMDGVGYVTQPPVFAGGEFVYEFSPNPPGTRWYHDHAFHMGIARGLFGMFIVDDPSDEPADKEFALVFHDVPQWSSIEAAKRGVSGIPMPMLPGSPEALSMMKSASAMPEMQGISAMRRRAKMGDEVAYLAHCIDGATYPRTRRLAVRSGDRVRLRILNASLTQTRYVRLAGHRLMVTHSDGNRLESPIEVEALRIGVGERYDAYFEVRKPGAFLLQGLTGGPIAHQQAALLYTEGMENAPPAESPESLVGVDYFTYQKAAGGGTAPSAAPVGSLRYDLTLDGDAWGSNRWTINGAVWPKTPKILVRRGDHISVHFKNLSDMDHPMHLHGHVFELVEVGGTWFARSLSKDVSIVPANGGTTTWRFTAAAPSGRWLLHCHNDIHAMDGMMAEVRYES
ncbi:MAG TPA: multicopper oxidase family protein [Candidatus Baltobacteraceae bacterium]|jgi:FtsP/CotA-like multicopper oxidase with cupredoxin domain|nr:multicopper oxidase family protein [Candidatus Baltobacteraceae bacterium]